MQTTSQPKHAIRVDRNLAITMRDGTRLFADVYRPQDDGRYPVLIERTPYDKDASSETRLGAADFYASRGYACVFQDVRGRFASEGEFYPFRDDGDGPNRDGYDTVEWAAEQPWSNGRVGTIGGSYSGATQYRMLSARPPHLVAQYVRQSASDYHNEWVYRSGAFELGFNLMWTVKHNATNVHRLAHPDQVDARRGILDRAMAELDTWMEHTPLNPLPLVEDLSPWYSHWLDHPDDGPYWWQWNIVHRHHDVDTPVFHLGGWFDGFLKGTIENYRGMRKLALSERARNGQKMAIGPWVHGPDAVDSSSCGEVDFGPEAVLGVMQARLEWFDYWLKRIDTGVLESPNVRLFTMGANRWREADAWPPPGVTYTPYYFHEGTSGSARSLNDGVLNQSQPEPAERPDSYVYDPRQPVRSLGGGHLGSPNGPHDQRPVEDRVLTYTTVPLERDMEVTGPVKAVLHALSSARDTDWVVRLTDVHPDGVSMQVCDGILRARYRHSRSEPQPLDGRVEVYEVDLWATSHLFKKGHRMRVAIASSSFPRWDRNMNTGGDNNREATGVAALNTIFHDLMRPSHILLPVMG